MHHTGNDNKLGKLIAPRRNNYFYGKLMDELHFRMEQTYGNRKRWLLNRLTLGEGVICGLNVTKENKLICISPGVAIDAYGREIIVPEPICIDPWDLTDECGKVIGTTTKDKVYICLAYQECEADLMPVLVTECNTQEDCKPGTIVESFRILVREEKPDPLPDRPRKELCDAITGALSEKEKIRQLCEFLSHQQCPSPTENRCVTIAEVTLSGGEIKSIDTYTYRPMVYSNETLFDMLLCLAGHDDITPGPGPGGDTTLTKVEEISWVHDSEIPANQFPDTFTVTFSDSITAPTKGIKGRAWFIVTLELPVAGEIISTHGSTSSIPVIITVLHLLAENIEVKEVNGKGKAIFTLYSDTVRFVRIIQGGGDHLGDHKLLCRIVIKCDFLLDSQGRAVDGNHLGGRLTSGDGIPGGDFESWLIITKNTET